MTDARLKDYLFNSGYLTDCTRGVIGYIPPTKHCPLIIQGKCVIGDLYAAGKLIAEGLTLEEFIAWESFHRVEGEGGFDEGEGGD